MSILLRWMALRFGCLSKKQNLWIRHTQGITWLTVGLTSLREVTHALFLFSSLFAFSRGTFFNGCDSIMHVFEAVLTDKSVLWWGESTSRDAKCVSKSFLFSIPKFDSHKKVGVLLVKGYQTVCSVKLNIFCTVLWGVPNYLHNRTSICEIVGDIADIWLGARNSR